MKPKSEKREWKVRAVNLPRELDKLIEDTRKRLGFSRSRFFATALTEYLRSLSVLSHVIKKHNGLGNS